jgi:hypothetical protein
LRAALAALGAAALLTIAFALPAAAGKPQMEKVPVNDVGIEDEFLTEHCGFPIFFDASGHFILRLFTNPDGSPKRELNNFAIGIRYYSANGSVRTRDVGVDRVTYLPDGSLINVVIGTVQSINVPGQGRVYADTGQKTFHVTFDPVTGEASAELLSSSGQHSETPLEDVLCDVLG